MKDSGVDWIGEMPSDWSTIRFKYVHNLSNTGEAVDKNLYSQNEGDLVFYMAGATPVRTTYDAFPVWKDFDAFKLI